MRIESAGSCLILTTEFLHVVVDSAQGGNITLVKWLPKGIPILTTNYHSTDVYVRLDGIGGFYTTGDRNGRVQIKERSGERVTVEAESALAPRPENPPTPVTAGSVTRRYTFWDSAPIICVETFARIDASLVGWKSTDARLVDMEANYDELTRFAYPGPDGRVVAGLLDKLYSGKTTVLSAPWYGVFGDRVGFTVRVDDPAKYCLFWTENATLGPHNVHGVAWLAQWATGDHPIGPDAFPLFGTFWVCFHEGPGPKEFAVPH